MNIKTNILFFVKNTISNVKTKQDYYYISWKAPQEAKATVYLDKGL